LSAIVIGALVPVLLAPKPSPAFQPMEAKSLWPGREASLDQVAFDVLAEPTNLCFLFTSAKPMTMPEEGVV
jgi:hypothetical protein